MAPPQRAGRQELESLELDGSPTRHTRPDTVVVRDGSNVLIFYLAFGHCMSAAGLRFVWIGSMSRGYGNECVPYHVRMALSLPRVYLP